MEITSEDYERAVEAAKSYFRMSSRPQKDAVSFIDGFLAREEEIKRLKVELDDYREDRKWDPCSMSRRREI